MAEEPRIEVTGDTLGSSRLKALLRYWTEKRGDRAMPSRGDIDPIEIPCLLPVALIADAAPDGMRIRLLGSEATNAYGRELRGLPVESIEFGDFSQAWRDAFARVAATGAPAVATGTYLKAADLHDVELVLMPLADDAGSLIQLFGGLLIRPVGRAVRSGDGSIKGWQALRLQDFGPAKSCG